MVNVTVTVKQPGSVKIHRNGIYYATVLDTATFQELNVGDVLTLETIGNVTFNKYTYTISCMECCTETITDTSNPTSIYLEDDVTVIAEVTDIPIPPSNNSAMMILGIGVGIAVMLSD